MPLLACVAAGAGLVWLRGSGSSAPRPHGLPAPGPSPPLSSTGGPAAPAARASTIVLRHVVNPEGIHFVHTDGSSGRRYIMETMSAGLALFDYNGDGLVDIYFLNGAPLRGATADTPPRNALYRNEGHWRFTDVTDEAGVGDTGFGLGVTVGDYNNDGYPDLYLNNFGPNVLYRNNGDGTFTDVTAKAGVACGNRVGAGASFLDMEGDGDLDLYVSNYVRFSYQSHRMRMADGIPTYPGPLDHEPDGDVLYRNNGDGTFTDVSTAAGVARAAATGMGMTCCDSDNDGDTDVFVANDVMANLFLQNDGQGRFAETAVQSGIAYDSAGMPQSSMGVDAGDYDNDGWLDLYVTSYQDELAVLYHNLGNGFFHDATRITGAGQGTLNHVTWGNGWVDFDNDGDRDLFIACGHTEDNIHLRTDRTAYMVPNLLLMNTGEGRFVNVSDTSGDGMRVRLASRGAGFDDLDNDGDVDVVILNSRREPTLLRNDAPPGNHWLQIRLQGAKSNRDGVGARVRVVAGDLVQIDEVHSGRGYQSHYGMRLHFGLGSHRRVDRIEIHWIGGGVDVIEDVPADRLVVIVEGAQPSVGRSSGAATKANTRLPKSPPESS